MKILLMALVVAGMVGTVIPAQADRGTARDARGQDVATETADETEERTGPGGVVAQERTRIQSDGRTKDKRQ